MVKGSTPLASSVGSATSIWRMSGSRRKGRSLTSERRRLVEMRPISAESVNPTLPSGPATVACALRGSGYPTKSPAVVIRPIAGHGEGHGAAS
jgi:hypothetical protein